MTPKAALWIAFYAVILYWGIRSMAGKRHWREIVWYVCIAGWCAYISLGKLYDWPRLSIVSPVNALFLPIGKWMERWMGGPPGE
ncbi:hypothetical protein ACFQI7_06465 [Paenibacillus allorhizosphaerae]|uniref:Uncharacterized protein n=1 Tax=Paenibacillus allorhizosphaerae TaxID=2849866 RepID=A0ABN7TJ02_9BACL|nr:hypothetical protein [Paenibacillus allorhizosphaerae]CAG7635213.1 hypothetical protein PAECIP111802_02112 [Paenibacillus allorhizosphaerae]